MDIWCKEGQLSKLTDGGNFQKLLGSLKEDRSSGNKYISMYEAL
jgi:hypothetical protein